MTGRVVTLNAAKGGINRLRTKGGADPSSLYDLVNGFVDQAGVMRARPGTIKKITLPTGTKGMCAYDGKLVTFSHVPKDMLATTPAIECEVLHHPTVPGEPLKEIHFAGPYMGYLYVVAEFTNEDVFHYWLEKGEVWEPNKVYLPGALVRPSNAAGIAYRLAGGTETYPAWARAVARAEGDVIVPTVDNGYKYTATDVFGPAPKSGSIEPAWPTSEGATIYEDTDYPAPVVAEPTKAPAELPRDVADRYDKRRSEQQLYNKVIE